MIGGNVNDHHKGRRVVTRATRHRRFGPDFPGWGAPQEKISANLLDTPEGIYGTVTHVESHGSNPWTRYSIRFDDGSHASGFCAGSDFTFTRS